MLKQMQQVRLSIHKKLNLANNLYYRKLIIFKNQFVSRQPDAVDCNVPEKPKEETSENKVPRKLWTDVISGNRKPENGMALEFFASKIVEGKPIAEIEPEDIIGELKYWESALIMYVIGRDLSMNSVKQFMEKNWSFVKLPDLFYNDEGYFIMRFHSSQDKDEILSKGPYTIMNMTMLLRT